MTDFNQQIIPYYSPISAKGGRKSARSYLRRKSRKFITRKHKRSNRRTRRRYH
jgi:hypothetical protein